MWHKSYKWYKRAIQVIHVIQVIQVMRVVQVMKVMQLILKMQVWQVMQVSLAHLEPTFELFHLEKGERIQVSREFDCSQCMSQKTSHSSDNRCCFWLESCCWSLGWSIINILKVSLIAKNSVHRPTLHNYTKIQGLEGSPVKLSNLNGPLQLSLVQSGHVTWILASDWFRERLSNLNGPLQLSRPVAEYFKPFLSLKHLKK